MRPYGAVDPLLTLAMRRYRRSHPDDRLARDPIRSVTAPMKSQRQFACRLCGFRWPPFRAPMPRELGESRAAHRCWVPADVAALRQRIAITDLGDELREVLRDQLEELTGDRNFTERST
jgi:hypothetical protein